MSIRIAINGYGRIGRCVLRALYESGYRDSIEIAGINELSDLQSLVHLTRFDSTHGTFGGEVRQGDEVMFVNGDEIPVFSETDFQLLPWGKLDVDIVFECSGSYSDRSIAQLHLDSGAKKVIFSSPATSDVDATIVYGLNEDSLRQEHEIISNASCTTNCAGHIIHLLDTHLGIDQGVVTIVHSSMNDQPVIDAYHNPDLRKNRSSGNSIIPVSTGLAKGIERLFPHLLNRFEAVSIRVPTMNVSLMQLSVNVRREAKVDMINRMLRELAEGPLEGVIGYTELPLVSCDFTHDPRSAVVDGSQTLISGENLVTVMAWFDNVWGYANRMLDTAIALVRARSGREIF
jgi:D-erythrose 4-phosphate dehydrogenase